MERSKMLKPDLPRLVTTPNATPNQRYVLYIVLLGWVVHLLFLNSSDFFLKYSISCSGVIPLIVFEIRSLSWRMYFTASNFVSALISVFIFHQFLW